MTPAETRALAEDLTHQMEPHLRRIVTDVVEDAIGTLLAHLGNEVKLFAEMRKHDRQDKNRS